MQCLLPELCTVEDGDTIHGRIIENESDCLIPSCSTNVEIELTRKRNSVGKVDTEELLTMLSMKANTDIPLCYCANIPSILIITTNKENRSQSDVVLLS